MATTARLGLVIFTGDKERLAQFYEAVTGLHVASQNDDITVLAAESFELVIHRLRGESVNQPALPGRPAAEPDDMPSGAGLGAHWYFSGNPTKRIHQWFGLPTASNRSF